MTLRHLRAFMAVAEELSFTSAARRLHISQPPLSRQIRHLETEIGVQLFLRTSQGIALTDQGRLFLQEARQLTTIADEFLETAQRVRRDGTDAVRIGVDWGLWKAVNRIRTHHVTQHPEIEIAAEDLRGPGELPDPAHAFRRHRIDVALTRAPIDAPSIACEPLFHEHVVVLLRDSHPLARARTVRLRDLANETLLMPDRRAGLVSCDKVRALYAAAGITPRTIQTRTGPVLPSGLLLVASGEGVYFGVGSGFTQPHAADGVAGLRLDEPNATVPVLLASRRHEPLDAVADFIRSTREVFARYSGRNTA